MAYVTQMSSAYAGRSTSPARGGALLRRTAIFVLGAAMMAMSGGGLAGYLDLSSATAAPAPAADAAPLG